MEQLKANIVKNDDSSLESYDAYINRIGKRTNFLGILVSFGPVFVLLAVFGIIPPASAILSAFIAIASAVGVNWIVEPISYFPIIGSAGTYMAFLTGNISNLRIPCAAVAQKVAGVEPGTREGNVIATLGMAVSVIINVLVLIIGVIAGTFLLNRLPDSVVNALNYLLPALFGAIFVQFALMKLKIAPIALGFAMILAFLINQGVFAFLPGTPNYVTTLGTVFGTIIISLFLYKKNLLK